jgi:hypothetical protein
MKVTRGRRSLCLLMALTVTVTVCPYLTGCAFYTRQPVTIAVFDAETDEPIAEAEVKVGYSYMLLLNPPKPQIGATDPDGRVVINAATFRPQVWDASAPGYLSSSHWIFKQMPDGVQFHLYRGPEPSLTVVVPDGYRGPLIYKVRPAPDRIQDEPGKRDFTFHATPEGRVEIAATPLLWDHVLVSRGWRVIVRFENGDRIPLANWETGSGEVALRWITGFAYVVGTESDERSIRPIILHDIGHDDIRGKPTRLD